MLIRSRDPDCALPLLLLLLLDLFVADVGMMWMTRSLSLFSILMLASACGPKYRTVEHKNYVLTVLNDEPAFVEEYQQLIKRFNDEVGFEALQFSTNRDEANSTITLTYGLNSSGGNGEGKVGWGQWVTETKRESVLKHVSGSRPKQTVDYSMRLEFDEQYVRDRIDSKDLNRSREQLILFAHEVGHGFQMNHSAPTSDVMYEFVNGSKDFAPYYERVRSFFGVR